MSAENLTEEKFGCRITLSRGGPVYQGTAHIVTDLSREGTWSGSADLAIDMRAANALGGQEVLIYLDDKKGWWMEGQAIVNRIQSSFKREGAPEIPVETNIVFFDGLQDLHPLPPMSEEEARQRGLLP
jgi:hypothetical protein